jgi:carbamoyl-phosphate synthase large subunit
MSAPTRTVLVTGIGGNVGQGILRVMRSLPRDLRIVGTNTMARSAGNHLCDVVQEVPYAWDAAYVGTMQDLCRRENVELIVPATDFETYHLARAAEVLPPLIASPAAVEELFLDKLLTAEAFVAAGLPFATSFLPSRYAGNPDHIIVKPRRGWGSRDIHLDPERPTSFSDDYVIQELLTGPELTAAFYVTRDRRIHGSIVLERELVNGTTMSCRTAFEHQDKVDDIVRTMCEKFQISGPCNVQAVLVPDGRLIPFEVNCRFSGTTSIRHNFGFRDVEWALDEWLYGTPPKPPALVPGRAERMLVDVIYPDPPKDDAGSRASRFFTF